MRNINLGILFGIALFALRCNNHLVSRTDRWKNSYCFRGPTWSDDHDDQSATIALSRF